MFVCTADRLEPLYILIRQKLSNALTKWHPSDRSAKLILQPWVGVFNPSHMNVFLSKNIVPKLALCMHEFTINPNQQQLGSFYLHLYLHSFYASRMEVHWIIQRIKAIYMAVYLGNV